MNESVIEQHRSGGCDRLINGYKKQIKNLQTQVEVEKSQNVVTKDGQRYTSDVVKAVIELVGEAEVTERCHQGWSAIHQ